VVGGYELIGYFRAGVDMHGWYPEIDKVRSKVFIVN
jgi:hypothetical protein